MAISEVDREDVIQNVLIELERTFTVLLGCVSPEHEDRILLLQQIEAAFKSCLLTLP